MTDLSKEKMMILNMISEEKITVEEGTKLLEALGKGAKGEHKRDKKIRKIVCINSIGEIGKNIEKKIRIKVEKHKRKAEKKHKKNR